MNDKDFITSKFEGENITAPESLNESNIKARLEQGTKAGDMIKLNKGKKRILKPVISVAACIAIVVGTLATANVIREQKTQKNFQSQAESGIIRFTNYDELKAFSEKMEPDSKEAGGVLGHFGVKSLYEKSESAVDYETEKSGEVEVDSHSETYKQVDGVDEADIVKNDGKYIYVLDQTDNSVAVYSAKNGKAKQVSRKFFDS
ncbi:MAG: beta-propeller domain-containing protein, partial [Eubacterium sp.]|nr:beta-propeller domain-containing protein [Eubacterium sp.]